MKRSLTFLFISVHLNLLCFSVSGQTIYWFQNVSVDAPVFDANGAPLSGPNYSVELYGGKTPEALEPALTKSKERLIIAFLGDTGAGYFQTPEAAYLWDDPALFSWLQVRAWDNRLGSTYAEAAARGLGGYGESPLFYAAGTWASDQFGIPAELIGLKSFKLRPVTPAVLMRSIRYEGDQITIEWNPGFTRYQLQQTASLDQAWQNVGDLTTLTTTTIPVSAPLGFFRVIGFLQ